MKCNYCGFESQEDFAVCPACSKEIAAPDVVNPVGERVKAALSDNLFLALCVLMTVSAVGGIIAGGIPVFQILFSIFLWIAFSKARQNIVDTNQLKNLSGTVYAQYVVFNVVAGMLIACGILSAFLMGALGGAGLFDSLPSEFDGYSIDLSGIFATVSGWLLLVIFLIIAAVILVINLLGWRKIHRFAKSVYQSINTYSDNVQYATAAKNWILAFGIVNAVSALTSGEFMTIVANGGGAGAAIIAYMLISKYIADNK